MLTPQEVSTHAFSKAVMGGYNMAMVDEFLDELTDDYTALYKENAALKAKMKVLVDKVEDYRATEDSMRATLLTAQRMADSIVREAESKRDGLISEAEAAAQTRINELRREIAEMEARLEQGKQELARFITSSQELCRKELEFLDQLPKIEVAAPVVAPVEAEKDTAVAEIEEKVMAAFQAVEVPQEESVEEPAVDEIADIDYSEADPFAEEESIAATRRINLSDLKFGRNYSEND